MRWSFDKFIFGAKVFKWISSIDLSMKKMNYFSFPNCLTNLLTSGNVKFPLIRHFNLDNSVSSNVITNCHCIRFASSWAYNVNKSPIGFIFLLKALCVQCIYSSFIRPTCITIHCRTKYLHRMTLNKPIALR